MIQSEELLYGKGSRKGEYQTQTRGYSSDAHMKSHFFGVRTRDDQEDYPDVATSMLQVFSINVYDLLNPGATLFVKTLVAMNFDVLPDVQSKPFSVISSMGDSVIAKRGYKNHPTMLPNRVTHVDLIELDMIDFDVILGMDWLDACV